MPLLHKPSLFLTSILNSSYQKLWMYPGAKMNDQVFSDIHVKKKNLILEQLR